MIVNTVVRELIVNGIPVKVTLFHTCPVPTNIPAVIVKPDDPYDNRWMFVERLVPNKW